MDGAFTYARGKTCSILGRGTVVTGRIERGIIKVGEEIQKRRYPRHQSDYRHQRGEMFPQAAGPRPELATT